jgi:hypothetical protein
MQGACFELTTLPRTISGTALDGAVFELIRRARNGGAAVLCAFDLIELEGEDLRRAPIEHRKHKPAQSHATSGPSWSMSTTTATARSCLNTPANSAARVSCQSGLVRRIALDVLHWVKVKNPKAPAVKREAEEDWGRLKPLRLPDCGPAESRLGNVRKRSPRYRKPNRHRGRAAD